jgi:hypothetical protein
MPYARQIRECASRPCPIFIFIKYLLSLSVRHSNDDVACARSTSQTKSGVSTIAIVCIVGSAGTSLVSPRVVPSKKSCDLTLPSYLPSLPAGRSSGK